MAKMLQSNNLGQMIDIVPVTVTYDLERMDRKYPDHFKDIDSVAAAIKWSLETRGLDAMHNGFYPNEPADYWVNDETLIGSIDVYVKGIKVEANIIYKVKDRVAKITSADVIA